MKKRIKMLESIAGLADPKPADLERKYTQLAKNLSANKLPQSIISTMMEEEKKKDREAVKMGFNKDWSFKVGDEAMVNAELADKWEDAGLCIIILESKKAA